MKNLANTFHAEIKKIWPEAQKNMTKINKDVSKLLKKSESTIVSASKKFKKSAEIVIFKAKREELYHELGKKIFSSLTSNQLKHKEIFRIASELKKISKSLRSKK